MKINELKPIFVDLIPEKLEEGKIYISRQYQISVHLCACGCGEEVVLPIGGRYGWSMTERITGVTFRPSVGNWNFPCKSHYYITDNKIEWL